MRKQVNFAFYRSLPVFFGYLFLGMSFGIMCQEAGYNFIWSFFISLSVYAGSGQFLLADLLSDPKTTYLAVFLMTFLVNSRHIFYGLSFIDKFHIMGKPKEFHMIYTLTDETYSTLCGIPDRDWEPNKKGIYLISVFDHCYWILGCVLGALAGQLIPIDYSGIEFSMTAIFVVILVEQLKKKESRIPSIIGFISAIIFFIILGHDKFLLPSLALMVSVLLIYMHFRKKEVEE